MRVDQKGRTIDSASDSSILGTRQVTGQVANEPVLVAGLLPKDVPQGSSLLIVLRGHLAGEAAHLASPLLVFCNGGGHLAGILESRGLERGVDIVGVGAVVVREVHVAITLVRGVDGDLGAVGGELLVVDSETVSGSVGVGKHAGLQHYFDKYELVKLCFFFFQFLICRDKEERWRHTGISRRGDAGHHGRWRKGSLLDIGKVVLGLFASVRRKRKKKNSFYHE